MNRKSIRCPSTSSVTLLPTRLRLGWASRARWTPPDTGPVWYWSSLEYNSWNVKIIHSFSEEVVWSENVSKKPIRICKYVIIVHILKQKHDSHHQIVPSECFHHHPHPETGRRTLLSYFVNISQHASSRIYLDVLRGHYSNPSLQQLSVKNPKITKFPNLCFMVM